MTTSEYDNEDLLAQIRVAVAALDAVTSMLLSLEHGVEVRPLSREERAMALEGFSRPRRRKRKWEGVDMEEMLRRHVAGETIKSLSDEVGMSQNWLYQRLHQLDPDCSQKAMLVRRQERYEARDRGQKPPPYVQISKVEDVEAARELWLEGATLQEIGDRYGVTRERIRQVIEQRFPGSGKEARRRRMERHDERKAEQAAQEEADREALIAARGHEAPACCVCGKPNLRALSNPGFTCCSHECSEAWPVLRYYIEEGHAEKHRMQMARWQVENETDPVKLRYAQRVLDGKVGRPVQHFGIRPGTKIWEVAKKFRPDLLEGDLNDRKAER